jgi:nucleotide-binding universal stress UspA family protein
MSKLLVPFDDSPSALRALEKAIAYARSHEGTALHVLTVLDDVGLDTQELIDAVEIERVLTAEANQQQQAARAVVEPTGLACVYRAVPGAPARVIADYARDHSIDHIVMGTRGLGKIAGLLLGSVATKVLHEVDCPVTLVK